MASLTAREAIRKEYGKSRNFMTPNLVRYGKINPTRAYELSWGSGLEPGTRLYGVSVVDIDENGETKRRTDLSNSFPSILLAERYISRLQLQ